MIKLRERLEELARTLGTRHADYATALNQLALLLIMHGDAQSAESMLREALEVRREVLGEGHPDCATNLSSLGGLLWARGALDDAMPLLIEAADIRVATLGHGHPKAVVALNSVAQLSRARRDAGMPHRPSRPRRERPAPERAGSVEDLGALAADVGRLEADFARLAERFMSAARCFGQGCLPADAQLETDGAEARRRFHGLRDRAAAHAEALPMAGQAREPGDLAQLSRRVAALTEAARRKREAAEEARRALALLRQVEGLSCRPGPGAAPLDACRAAAAALRRRTEQGDEAAVRDELRALLDGTHAYVSLLALARADDTVDDETWVESYRAVERGLGTPLAVAAARGRIRSTAS